MSSLVTVLLTLYHIFALTQHLSRSLDSRILMLLLVAYLAVGMTASGAIRMYVPAVARPAALIYAVFLIVAPITFMCACVHKYAILATLGVLSHRFRLPYLAFNIGFGLLCLTPNIPSTLFYYGIYTNSWLQICFKYVQPATNTLWYSNLIALETAAHYKLTVIIAKASRVVRTQYRSDLTLSELASDILEALGVTKPLPEVALREEERSKLGRAEYLSVLLFVTICSLLDVSFMLLYIICVASAMPPDVRMGLVHISGN
ncbi:hypothetical protein HDU91_006211, partial [Kappamyces sp. JEL0680]